ncbi:MAG: glutathione peroxidase [Bacteroidales bacterium]|nr:glutathione peroxidase [Bacteroidales bacterium]
MKKYLSYAALLLTVILISGFVFLPEKEQEKSKLKTFHDFKVKTIDGRDFDLASLKGKKVLVVNTASKCGLTPQYEVLQKLYESLDKSKFEIIGFPANNFLSQEPGTEAEIKEFCTKNYGVTFPMMEKVSVCDYIYQSAPPDPNKAEKTNTSEIYKWLTKKELNGVMDVEMQWNFQKFLIDEDGHLMGFIPPRVGKELLLMKEWFGN